MADSDAIDRGKWGNIRRDFEGSVLTDAAICRKHKVTRDDLWTYAREHRWETEHRGFDLDRSILIRQMLAVVDHQVARLENLEMTEMGEKETTVLGRLSVTLGKLIDMNGASGGTAGEAETREMRDLRNKLAKRIERLKRG